MAIETLAKLRERVHSVFAQGLQVCSPDEFEVLAQELSALKLEQPAALLKQIQQNVVNRAVEKKDVEALVKVLQILAQAEIHLSAPSSVNTANLVAVQGVYLNPAEIPLMELSDLNAILQIPNKFVRGSQVVAYLKHASYDALVQSIEIVWFDYALARAIREGLRERPEDALKLAQIGLGHANLVIQRTALKVLENVGQEPVYAQETLKMLRNFLDRSTVPMVHIVAEVIARLEGRYPDYLRSQRARFEQWAKTVKSLSSRKKGERAFAAKNIANIKDPCFREVLLRALYEEEDGKTIKVILHALVEIGGFEAIRYLTWMLTGEHAQHALRALTRFRDRSALTFLFSPKGLNTPPSYYRELLPLYGDLTVNPLLAAIKTLENPGAYKAGFTNLFVALRSNAFAQAIIDRLEHDVVLAEKFGALMQRMYPKVIKKTDVKTTPGVLPPALRQLIGSTLGGERIAKMNISVPRFKPEAMTPDGKYLASLSERKVIDIFNVASWQPEQSLTLNGYPSLIAITSDGKYLLFAEYGVSGREREIEIWEFGKWDGAIASLTFPTEIQSLTVTSDNRHLVIGGESSVKVVEFGTGRAVTELPGHTQRVYYARTLPGRKCVLTGDWSGLLQVWDETTWHKIAELQSDSWSPRFTAVSADGQYLVYGGFIGIKVWETQTWTEVVSLNRPKNLNCIALTPDGKYLLAGSAKKLKFLEFGSWKNILTLDDDDYISSLFAHPDGKTIITGGRKGSKVWQVDLSSFET